MGQRTQRIIPPIIRKIRKYILRVRLRARHRHRGQHGKEPRNMQRDEHILHQSEFLRAPDINRGHKCADQNAGEGRVVAVNHKVGVLELDEREDELGAEHAVRGDEGFPADGTQPAGDVAEGALVLARGEFADPVVLSGYVSVSLGEEGKIDTRDGLPAGCGSHGRHLCETDDDEELADDDPDVAPEHPCRTAVDKHLEIVQCNELRAGPSSVLRVSSGKRGGRHIKCPSCRR